MFSVFCSMSFYTYAVMGVNTAFIQAALLSRAKVYTVLPAKIQAKIDIVKGNFKFDFLPVQGIDRIVSATYVIYSVMYYQKLLLETLTGNYLSDSVDTYAVARNVEDISAAKMAPIFPNQISLDPKEESSSMRSSSSITVR